MRLPHRIAGIASFVHEDPVTVRALALACSLLTACASAAAPVDAGAPDDGDLADAAAIDGGTCPDRVYAWLADVEREHERHRDCVVDEDCVLASSSLRCDDGLRYESCDLAVSRAGLADFDAAISAMSERACLDPSCRAALECAPLRAMCVDGGCAARPVR